MTSVTVTVAATRERVYAVLTDGWAYAGWVVGATHVRDVDPGWPAVGTRIHHSVGLWPLVVNDTTEVRAVEPGRRLELRARAWPMGSAHVLIELSDDGPDRTTVRMEEHAESGPARLLPRAVQAALLIPRNRESLTRLSHLATGRAEDPVQR